eukprot:TRINITY_DN8545_c0_g1_i1.p1 TRINITY_DN8545_c0_g1~~TRINITY_DN8545_c0_g1_i1.p1  ORF type:complete len:278 (+),score=48.71 TRINITY_DN8545_c0_g1_i1:30-863(+)
MDPAQEDPAPVAKPNIPQLKYTPQATTSSSPALHTESSAPSQPDNSTSTPSSFTPLPVPGSNQRLIVTQTIAPPREYTLLLEYKYVQAPSGVYVLPSSESIFVWHGVIFIRAGTYRSGFPFKFVINIPEDYPDTSPRLRVTSDVFHPFISPSDGSVNVDAAFPTGFKEPRIHMRELVEYVKRIFYKFETERDDPRVLNKEAWDMFTLDQDKFIERVSSNVSDAESKVFEPVAGSVMRFSDFSEDKHRHLLNTVVSSKKSSLGGWLASGVSKLISIKY